MAKQRWTQRQDAPPPRPAATRAGRSRWKDGGVGRKRKPDGRRTNWTATAAAAALLVVIASLVGVVRWLNPTPPARLAVLTARYRSPMWPPNALAVNDARALYNQRQVLDSAYADSDSLGAAEMHGLVQGLRDIHPRRFWFPWQKTVTLVYVNALGLAVQDRLDAEPVAYLVPDDVQAPVRPWSAQSLNLVPVSQVIAGLVESQADHKVLVLDCQRVETMLPLGVAANTFVDAVRKQLNQLPPEQRQGLYVLFSCSPEEVTWVDAELQQSVFGYYFARGIAGAADAQGGDNDGRVTLEELFSYVSRNVSGWVRNYRADRQIPLLESFGQDPGAVIVAAVADGGGFRAPPAEMSADRAVLLNDLRAAWERYYQLLQQDPPPLEYAPALWNYYETTLLRAESFLLAADLDAAQQELRNLTARHNALDNARTRLADRRAAFSLAMQDFVEAGAGAVNLTDPAGTSGRNTGTAGDDAISASGSPPGPMSPALADAPLLDVSRIVQDVSQGRLGFREAAQQLSANRQTDAPLVIEAHLIRMLADFFSNHPHLAQNTEVQQQARGLIGRRLAAEQAVTTGRTAAPDVFPWIRQRADGADALRRSREDRLFAESAASIPLAAAGSSSDDLDAADLYRRVSEDGRALAEAVRLRKQVLSELRHLVRLIEQRPWQPEPPQFNVQQNETDPAPPAGPRTNLREEIKTLTESLLAETRTLNDRLEADPRPWTLDRTDDEIRGILAASEQVAGIRAQVHDLLAAEARSLSESTDPPRSRTQWRRIHDRLCVPFPSEHRDASLSAEVRMTLVGRALQSVSQTGTSGGDEPSGRQTAGPPTGGNSAQQPEAPDAGFPAQRQRALEFAQIVESLYSLAVRRSDRIESGDVGVVGRRLAQRWIELFDQPVRSEVRQDDEWRRWLIRGDAVSRVVEGYAAMNGPYWMTDRLNERNLSQFYAWQAARFAEDFWAGTADEAEPYFLRTAGRYLQVAQSLDPDGSAVFHPLERRLSQLKEAGEQLRVQPSRATIYFRGTDDEDVQLRVAAPPGAPAGIAALRCAVDSADVELRSLPPVEGRSDHPYRLLRLGSDARPGRLLSQLYFRGRRIEQAVPVRLADENDGAATIYRNEKPQDAEVLVRPAELGSDHVKLLFVLDCSASMGLPAGSGVSRMTVLRNTIERFARETPAGSLDVGVRVFGRDVVWRRGDPPEVMAKAQRDTQLVLPIGPFNRYALENTVRPLKPTGSTPLYQALLEARNDFADVRGGRKRIVVISDGADNWVNTRADYPGFNEFRQALAGSGIQVHAIGFQLDNDADFEQLRSLASATGGQCVRAEAPEDLFNQVTGLAGFLKYGLYTDGRRFPPAGEPLRGMGAGEEPIRVPPGVYDVRVTNPDGRLVADPKTIRVLAGEQHELLYQSGRLQYAPGVFQQPLAQAENQETGAQLAILRATPRGTGVDFQVALSYGPQAGRQTQWQPQSVSVFVRGVGSRELFSFQNLPPNTAGYHIPVWSFFVENWPANVRSAEIEVRWSNPGEQQPRHYEIKWNQEDLAGELPQGFRITRRVFGPQEIDGQIHEAAWVTLVFPENEPQIQDWSVGFSNPVRYARQIYNTTDGIYTGRFLLERNTRPDKLILYRPRPVQQQYSLKATAPVRLPQIND